VRQDELAFDDRLVLGGRRRFEVKHLLRHLGRAPPPVWNEQLAQFVSLVLLDPMASLNCSDRRALLTA
jgi:hypothetical protein